MKKGISLVIMLVTIAVILILTSVTVVTGNNIYNNTKKVKFATEISYVEEIANTYRLNNNGMYPSSNMIYIDCLRIKSVDLNEQFNSENISADNMLLLYKIDFSMLNPHELMYADINNDSGDNVYCISPTTGRVYFLQGVKIGRKTYYTLTDDLKKSINYVEDNNVNDGIIFLDDYKGNLKIKIPDEYTDINITSSNGEITVTQDSITEYKIYNVSYTTGSLITVSYKKDNILKELKYNVSEVSNNKPEFNISEIKTMVNSKTGKEEKYVKLENVPNNVKIIKYANQILNESKIKDYFQTGGIEIQKDDVITIPNNSLYNITVYIEDKYGNYNYKKISNADIDSYIKSNLVLQVDGIKNTRNGHSINTAVWEDLSGNGNDYNLNNVEILNKSIKFLGNSNSYGVLNTSLAQIFGENVNDVRTIELVVKPYTTSGVILSGGRTSQKAFGFFNAYLIPTISIRNTFLIENALSKSNYSIIYNNNVNVKQNTVDIEGTKNDQWDITENISYIGKRGNGNTSYSGEVMAIRIYNRALTEEEIKHNYEIDKLRFGL